MEKWFPRTLDGKNTWASSDLYVFSSVTVVPRLALGQLSEVEIEIPVDLVPVITSSSFAGLSRSSAVTVRPVLSVARGATTKVGTFPKTSEVTIRPVLSESASVAERFKTSAATLVPSISVTSAVSAKGVATSATLVPVITSASSVDAGFVEKLSSATLVPVLSEANSIFEPLPQRFTTASLVPVVSVSNVATDLFMDKASSVTLIPVLAELFDTEQTAGFVSWTLPIVASPVLQVTNSIVNQSGEVDVIEISASASGQIDFRYI